MVEAFVDEQQREGANAQRLRNLRCRATLAAPTVPDVEDRSHAIEERVARAFKKRLLEERRRESVLREEAAVRALLPATFGMAKRAHDRKTPANERGVCCEDEIRNSGTRFHALDANVARTLERFDQAIPLPRGVRRFRSDVPRHPRIDVVRNRKIRGRTHQKSCHDGLSMPPGAVPAHLPPVTRGRRGVRLASVTFDENGRLLRVARFGFVQTVN